jgi:hypothetical protein
MIMANSNSNGGSRSGASKTAAPKDPGSGLGDALQQQHDSRVELQDESVLGSDEVVDARLDNREGAARPRRVEFPAVPQQVDGPDVAHQAEFTRRYLENVKAEPVKDALGMHSPGPHGLSDEEARQGKDRADESGGEAAPNGEEGSPVVGKPEALGSQRR